MGVLVQWGSVCLKMLMGEACVQAAIKKAEVPYECLQVERPLKRGRWESRMRAFANSICVEGTTHVFGQLMDGEAHGWII